MMNRATFMWLFETSVGFNRFLVHQLNERMGQFIATIECDRMHDPTARVARHLAWLFNPVLYPNAGATSRSRRRSWRCWPACRGRSPTRACCRLEAAGLLVNERGGIRIVDAGEAGALRGVSSLPQASSSTKRYAVSQQTWLANYTR